MVYSASYNNSITKNYSYFMNNQLKNVIFGFVIMIVASYVNYHRIVRLGWGWFWLLAAVAIIAALKTPLAHSELGATRWIKLGPVSFQAAEPIKAAIIIFFAYYVSYWGLNRWYNQLLACLLAIALLGFLFLSERKRKNGSCSATLFAMPCKMFAIFLFLPLLLLIEKADYFSGSKNSAAVCVLVSVKTSV